MDGNERFFVCCKTSCNREADYKDEKGVLYFKPSWFPGRSFIATDPNGTKRCPLAEDKKALTDGFDTLEEACALLKEIKEYNAVEAERQRIEDNKRIGIPMECPE